MGSWQPRACIQYPVVPLDSILRLFHVPVRPEAPRGRHPSIRRGLYVYILDLSPASRGTTREHVDRVASAFPALPGARFRGYKGRESPP